MKVTTRGVVWCRGMAVGLTLFTGCLCARAQEPSKITPPEVVRIAAVIGPGTVEVLPPGANVWVLTQTNQILSPGFHLRTGPDNRVVLRWPDQSVVTFGSRTEVEILPSNDWQGQPGLHLWRGLLSFFHRGTPGRVRILNQGTTAGVEGTEFVVDATGAGPAGATRFYVVDGNVRLTNPSGSLTLTNGQHALIGAGQAPILQTAGFIAKNVLQWCLYYPAVLDLRDLPLTAAERGALEVSFNSYRAGDLAGALAAYAGRPAQTANERIYHAALLLSVGKMDEAQMELSAVSQGGADEQQTRLVNALGEVMAAVLGDTVEPKNDPQTSTELLARSYYEQSRAVRDESLEAARQSAEAAVERSPDFGFAWVRLAELEFSFGRTPQALAALERGLSLSPRNGAGLALRGFLQAAQNRMRTAEESFEGAIASDPALANAWLGRGLVRYRRGDVDEGREDLLMAAALEPNRAILRSYLAKAWTESRDEARASHELELAKILDPSDPTAWFYAALLNQQNNRINEGIRDLEESQRLNDNRRVYRSKLLLDQDSVVRSANLANLFRDAGMSDVGVREAARAVSIDYANYSAHLFLADSYNALRDPNRVNLRYETPAVSEYLLANLLAPAGAGSLSPVISQQEYGRLLERNRAGLVSSTEYLSRGAWLQSASQYGLFNHGSYALEGAYRSDPGQRPNNDIEEYGLAAQFKVQLTGQDSLYFRVNRYEAKTGDLQQYYEQENAVRGFQMSELQNPIALAGYHREWKPGLHTLVLGTRLDDRITVTNPLHRTLMVSRSPDGLDFVEPMTVEQTYRSELEIYTAEAQQIWQRNTFSSIFGVLYQRGDIETTNRDVNASLNIVDLFNPQGVSQEYATDFERFSAYAYHHQRIVDSLLLVGGVSYDWVQYPENFRSAPISGRTETREQVSPKAGLVWTPVWGTVVRGAYSRSLGGASIDQSFRLEPTQVAGINQSFRSILPESVGGTQAGARFEVAGVSLEQKLRTGTYLGLSVEQLESDIDRVTGVYVVDFAAFANPGGTREKTHFRERTLVATVDQLLGDEWSTGMGYRLSDADLEDRFPEIVPGAGVPSRQHVSALLHQLDFHLFYTSPAGWFAQGYALWNHQSNDGYPVQMGDDFWQFNLLAGYRLAQRRIEVTVGLLNLTDRNYQLNPLTLYNELPRERTLMARLRLSF